MLAIYKRPIGITYWVTYLISSTIVQFVLQIVFIYYQARMQVK